MKEDSGLETYHRETYQLGRGYIVMISDDDRDETDLDTPSYLGRDGPIW